MKSTNIPNTNIQNTNIQQLCMSRPVFDNDTENLQHFASLKLINCQRIKYIFKMPQVYADSIPSATDRIQSATKVALLSSSGMVTEMDIQNYIKQETGVDRLRKMFEKNELGEYSFEYSLVRGCAIQTGTIAFFLMGFFRGREYKEEFVQKHKATVYSSRFQATASFIDDIAFVTVLCHSYSEEMTPACLLLGQSFRVAHWILGVLMCAFYFVGRRFSDAVFVESMKHGAKWAIKVSLFSGLFVGISQCVAVYRNKSSPFEYAFAAAVTGGIMKTTLGIKAMISGSIVSAVLGMIGGTVFWGILSSLNETQEVRHHWQIQKYLIEGKENKGLRMPSELVSEVRAVS